MNRFTVRFVVFVCLSTLSVGNTVYAVNATAQNLATPGDNEDSDRIEVSIKDGYIYVTTSRNVTISLYTILGQLIVRQTVQPGVTRIKAPSRGVYILQAGSVTRRVTVN